MNRHQWSLAATTLAAALFVALLFSDRVYLGSEDVDGGSSTDD
ncbi:MAG: hypothetical protein ACQETI_03225 [Halobacteriota archaeon]